MRVQYTKADNSTYTIDYNGMTRDRVLDVIKNTLIINHGEVTRGIILW